MDVVLPTCLDRPGRLFSDLDRARILARSRERNLREGEPWTIHVLAADEEEPPIRAALEPFRLDFRFPVPPELQPKVFRLSGIWNLEFGIPNASGVAAECRAGASTDHCPRARAAGGAGRWHRRRGFPSGRGGWPRVRAGT